MLILVDTGVLLRLLDRADPHHQDIRRALRLLQSRGDTLVTSAQNVAEFWNTSTRAASARGGYGLSLAETHGRLRILERVFGILPDTSAAYPEWRRLVAAHGVIGASVHDARLVALMSAHGIKHILTLNGKDFARYRHIVVWHPRDVLTTTPNVSADNES